MMKVYWAKFLNYFRSLHMTLFAFIVWTMIRCQICSILFGFARFDTVPAFGMLGVNN